MTTINLSGPEGNAFYILGKAQQYCKDHNFTPEKTKEILDDMKSKDYKHLVYIFQSQFGDEYEIV